MKTQRSFRSIVSQESSRVQLPKIPEAKIAYEDNEVYENPFYVPADEEIFNLKNKEKDDKELERRRIQGLKIWQKGIKYSSEGKLRKIMELTNIENVDPDDQNGKLNIVDAANSAIRNRVRHKEPLTNFLNKKREMFLFQMTINEKKEQIKEFEELAYLQEISLQNSKDLLEKDAETFKQHIEKNKNETRQAIKNAEDETKAKQKKIQEMKQIQEDLSTIMSKNTKQLEKLEKLYTYKLFLDKLTPDDFWKKQKETRDQKKRALSVYAPKEPETFNWQIYNLNLSPGILELLNDNHEENGIYFHKPTQLQELFENLEEKNLFIIKYTQDIEKSLEELKHGFESKKKILMEREKQLKKNKQELEKAIQARNKGMNQLRHFKDDKFTDKILRGLETVIKQIYDSSKLLKEGKPDQQVSGFDILRLIERKLDFQLKEMKQNNPQKVLEQYKLCMARRREEANELKKKELEEEQKEKLEKIRKRLLATKRMGRPIMKRSMLLKDDKQETEVDEEDEEENERRLYFTIRFQ